MTLTEITLNGQNHSIVRKALGIFARGLLLGLGFGISIAIIAFAAQNIAMRTMSAQVETLTGSTDSSEAKLRDVVLSEVIEQKEVGRDSIIGLVKNGGSKPLRGVQIEANLFLKGKFVDQYSTYVSGSIKPGETRFFKISCGCKDSAPAEHDSFKVSVVSSY